MICMKQKRDSQTAGAVRLTRSMRLSLSTDELREHLDKVLDRVSQADRALDGRGDNRLGIPFAEEPRAGECTPGDVSEARCNLQDLRFYAELARDAIAGNGLYSIGDADLMALWKSGDLAAVARLGTANKARLMDLVVRERSARAAAEPMGIAAAALGRLRGRLRQFRETVRSRRPFTT